MILPAYEGTELQFALTTVDFLNSFGLTARRDQENL